MTITEAAACGTPAVVTDNHGHRAAVIDGETGLLVSGTDSLAGAVVELIGDPGRLRLMAEAAFRNSARYDWDLTALRTLEVLLEARRRQRP